MWTRASVVMMIMAGCVGVGPAAESTAAAQEDAPLRFHCLNSTSIHVVTCTGSISLFPITITVDNVRILSDNEINILDDDLDDLTVIDGDIVDHNPVLDDIESVVLDDFLNRFGIVLSRAAILVCTTEAGTAICK